MAGLIWIAVMGGTGLVLVLLAAKLLAGLLELVMSRGKDHNPGI